jgi:hypothetical protein
LFEVLPTGARIVIEQRNLAMMCSKGLCARQPRWACTDDGSFNFENAHVAKSPTATAFGPRLTRAGK